MRKVLMRAVMSPLGENRAIDVITKNLIGDNIGNMIFAYSTCRTLMTADTQVDTIATNRSFTKEEIEQLNAEYDCFIIPLANAFRNSFIPELSQLTALVKGLTIPCVIVGVGIQAKLGADLTKGYRFDETAKKFVDAVLEKSTMIGVRGQITAAYLKQLGYVEDKHYTVIGCPSMYIFGKDLPKARKKELTRDSVVSMNFKIDLSPDMHKLFARSRQELPNYFFIPQSIQELRLIYAGVPYTKKHKFIPESYPLSLADDVYKMDRVRSFVNVDSWLDFLRGVDFSFGSRIHGNIAAILAGTPCYIFAADARICELAEYHNIPFMPAKDIREDTSVLKIHETVDFDAIQRGHEERFLHFLDFLNQNGIAHIYDANGEAANVPFDTVLAGQSLEPPIRSFSSVSLEEQEERLRLYHNYEERRFQRLKKELEEEKQKETMEVKLDNWKTKIFSKIGL